MKKNYLAAAAVLSALLSTQACAEKPAPALQSKSAVLQCLDRKIELQADCLPSKNPLASTCTRQSLTFKDGADRQLGERIFRPAPQQATPAIEEKVSELVCAETPRGDKYIVARMDNGGNCDNCEWLEVFGWDGAPVGSDRDKKNRNKAVAEASNAAFNDATKKVIQKKDLGRFYQGSTK
ncbi:hypothetical protein [Janthinobacterium agaricidamnosum]|uniref:Lipoprotein n=1 Tax=Janthinobacterium agaricidamnosum NBRC 102515 = DSM 9628 TaxID=1349767 RepID=W0V6I2_9BURK|nr:hypothetical protein [Janthinobacterium agaricidamnosum]CDG83225.1 hypothetical protein GJA_2594 [Janthinobacterium agaricidamnosum NBRC 102515 = DSM 9628]